LQHAQINAHHIGYDISFVFVSKHVYNSCIRRNRLTQTFNYSKRSNIALELQYLYPNTEQLSDYIILAFCIIN